MKTRVLVAEDDADMRNVLICALAAVGVKNVAEAARGDEAIRLVFENDFDLLLLDWYMPGLAGLEIVRAIRTVGSTIPIIMITGETRREPIVEAIRSGVSDYLIKPFDHAILLQKLTKYCTSPIEPDPSQDADLTAEYLQVAGRPR